MTRQTRHVVRSVRAFLAACAEHPRLAAAEYLAARPEDDPAWAPLFEEVRGWSPARVDADLEEHITRFLVERDVEATAPLSGAEPRRAHDPAPAVHAARSGSTAPLPDDSGQVIDGRYAVVRVLGRGGFGSVYLVEDLWNDRQRLALKELLPKHLNKEDFERRFKNEILTQRALDHPGIPRVFNDGRTEHGGWYYTMAYVEGVSLTDVIEKDVPLAPERVVRFVRQMLDVLEYAHAKGVVHRDLKPDNIKIVDAGTEREQVRVLDFGIAKIVEREGLLEQVATLHTEAGIGTPHYMSPEQVRNRGIDGRSDLYALGVIVYEMCSGKLPFHGTSAFEIAAARLETPPEPLGSEDAPHWLADLVSRLLERERERRPSTQELRAELDRLAQGQVSQGRLLRWVAAGLVVVLATVAAGFRDDLRRVFGGPGEEIARAEPGPSPPPESDTPDDDDPANKPENDSGNDSGEDSADSDDSSLADDIEPGPGSVPAPVVIPTASITSRAPAYCSTDSLTVEGVASGVAALDLRVFDMGPDGNEVGRPSGSENVPVQGGTFTAKLRLVMDRVNRIEIRKPGADASLEELTIRVDGRDPKIELTNYPRAHEDGTRYVGSTAQVSGTVADDPPGEVARLERRLDGGEWIEVPLVDGTFDESVSSGSAGMRRHSFRVTDKSGRSKETELELVVDTIDPTIQLSDGDEDKVEGILFDSSPVQLYLCEDEDSDPLSEGELIPDEGGTFKHPLDLRPGKNSWWLIAVDAAGNRAKTGVERSLQPELAIVEPAPVGAGRESVRIQGTADFPLARVLVNDASATIYENALGFDFTYSFTDREDPREEQESRVQIQPYFSRDGGEAPGQPKSVTLVREAVQVPRGFVLPEEWAAEGSWAKRVLHEETHMSFVLVERPEGKGGPFYLGEYEVTLGQCALAAGKPEPSPTEGNRPLAGIDFETARKVAESLGGRLPTPEEWIWAARNGDTAHDREAPYPYPWGADWAEERCNSFGDDDGYKNVAPVGSFPEDVSWCGAMDMGGNVSEWCQTASRGQPKGGSFQRREKECAIDYPQQTPRSGLESLGMRVLVEIED